MIVALSLVSAENELGWATIHHVARPRVDPPALGRAVLPGGEPLLAVASGAGRAMGMAVGPEATNPMSATTPRTAFTNGLLEVFDGLQVSLLLVVHGASQPDQLGRCGGTSL
jgi:hypothetical protein